jgi:hypothetical protein
MEEGPTHLGFAFKTEEDPSHLSLGSPYLAEKNPMFDIKKKIRTSPTRITVRPNS